MIITFLIYTNVHIRREIILKLICSLPRMGFISHNDEYGHSRDLRNHKKNI